MKKTLAIQLLIFVFATSLCGCNPSGADGGSGFVRGLEPQWTEPANLHPEELGEGEKLEVVATTTIVGDVVSFIGGSEIELTVLMPFNVDPHSFEPAPGDLRSLSDADVIFINGLGLESSLYDYFIPITDHVPVISLSAGISTREYMEGEGENHGDESNGGTDPHVWFDPANVKYWVTRITTTLSNLNPAKSTVYEKHGETYAQFLDNLDKWIEESVKQIPADQRIIVSDHYIFGYFAERYGFEMAGAVVPVYSSAAEPSAQEIADLEEAISKLGVRVIFVGETVNPDLARGIAEDSGIQLVKLYTGSLSDPEGPAASYLNFMQYNVTQIVNALLD